MNRSCVSRALSIALVCGFSIILSSCGTYRNETKIHPGDSYQENSDDFSAYQSSQKRKGQNDQALFAVSISGGGHRAANLGIGALLGLEEIETIDGEGNALLEVDLFSTVSGGGFAAGIYMSTLKDFLATCGEYTEYSLKDVLSGNNKYGDRKECYDPNARRHLERGYKDDALGFLNPFKSSSWRVWFTNLDRTNLLEQAVDDDLLGGKWRREKDNNEVRKLALGDIFIESIGEQAPKLPYWVTNASAYENGEIFTFKPLTLRAYRIVGYTHRLQPEDYEFPDGGYESDEYANYLRRVPMSIAVTASGNFPVALPATTLRSALDPDNPYLHLLDGGLSDNLGVLTAVRFLEQEIHRNGADKKLLVVIDAYKGPLGPFSRGQGAPSWSDAIGRTTSVYLDSWRGRYRELIRKLMDDHDVEVVFVTPEALDDLRDYEKLLDLEYYGIEDLKLTRNDVDKLTTKWKKRAASSGRSVKDPTPFDLFRAVATDYNVSIENQKLLIAMGRALIQEQAPAIRAGLAAN